MAAERMSVSRVLVAIIPDDEFEAVSLALIGNELADLKQALGRDCIESISCGGAVFGYSDEEGRRQEHSPNYLASALAMALGWRPMPGDYLAGPVLLCGLDEGHGRKCRLAAPRRAVFAERAFRGVLAGDCRPAGRGVRFRYPASSEW
jgi:hypothetical protein